MGKRREGREAAVQFLYQLDLHGAAEAGDIGLFWDLRTGPESSPPAAKTRAFTEELIHGVLAHRAEIDARIVACTANYDLHRIAAVDRNILRVAIYELLHSLNEAIEVAKKFGAEKSGGFVNGILDRIKKELNRPDRVGIAKTES